jgi:hypothetical protein
VKHKWTIFALAALAAFGYIAFVYKPKSGSSNLVDQVAAGIQGAVQGFVGQVADQVNALQDASEQGPATGTAQSSGPTWLPSGFDPNNPVLPQSVYQSALSSGLMTYKGTRLSMPQFEWTATGKLITWT